MMMLGAPPKLMLRPRALKLHGLSADGIPCSERVGDRSATLRVDCQHVRANPDMPHAVKQALAGHCAAGQATD